MKTVRTAIVSPKWLVPLLAVLAGCVNLGAGTAEPTRFYLLQPLASAAPADRAPASELRVAVGPVRLPGYLDRPYLVTRTGPNGIALADFAQWAEPLGDNVTRVLRENLSVLLGTDRVSSYPAPGPVAVDARVWADVARFDADDRDAAVLEVRWGVVDGADRERAAPRVSRFREALAGGGYPAVVAAESRCLAAWSRQVAATVATLIPEVPTAVGR